MEYDDGGKYVCVSDTQKSSQKKKKKAPGTNRLKDTFVDGGNKCLIHRTVSFQPKTNTRSRRTLPKPHHHEGTWVM